MDQIVQVLKALGDETRLKILIIISRRRICAKGLSSHLNISEAAVSQHLKVLKEAGIIIGEKYGYFVRYNIQRNALSEIIEFIEEINEKNSTYVKDFGLNISIDCKASCKANQNRCCNNNI